MFATLSACYSSFLLLDHIVPVQGGWDTEGVRRLKRGRCLLWLLSLCVCVGMCVCAGAVSAVTKKLIATFFSLLLTLYSCGNVIVLVLVHLIDNWFMMILVAVYVYLKINAMKSPCLSRITSPSPHCAPL